MKLSVLLTCILAVNLMASVYSQNARFDLDIKDQSVRDILKTIEKESPFRFFYNDEFNDLDKKLTFSTTGQSIDGLMSLVLDNTEVSYKVLENNFIVITPKSLLQQNKVTGTVTDEKGNPIPGVTIAVKGTTRGTTSDFNGNYTIENINPQTTLVFSFIGYKSQEITIGNRVQINISLSEEVIGLEEVVVIGYGTQRKVEVTSSVASVKADGFVKGTVKDAGQLLQGKIAGLNIGTSSGAPNSSSEIMLRGIGTLSASVSPLILVDGIPAGINTVAPEDIESIDVLKDASAAAIYGTRGSNGVILITTRKATGVLEPTLSYSGYISTQSFFNLPDMLTGAEYRERLAQGQSGFFDFGSSTNWIKEISRNMPISYDHNFSLRGGNNKTNYFATISYRSIQGVIITTENKEIKSRIDINHNMLDDKLKLNLNYIQNDTKSSASFDTYAFRGAIRYNPTSPVYKEDGTYFENFGPTGNYNPVAMIKETFGGGQSQSYRLSGSLIWKPFNDLNVKVLTSRSKTNSLNSVGLTKLHWTTIAAGLGGQASKSIMQSIDNLLELTAEYSKKINLHNFSALAGYSYQDNETERAGMTNSDFPVGNFSYIDNIGAGESLQTGKASLSSSKYASNLIGFFGRATYNYQEKYLLMANLRYEAASQFVGTNQPWGLFPSVSAGWRISEENFMKGLDFLNDLKLRAGYGVTGTLPGELFLGVSRLGYSGSFLINGKWVQSLAPISNANPYLRWEEKHETNIGVDFTILNGRVSGSIDGYKRKTDGLLFDYQVPSPPNLYTTTKANVGILENKGIEVLISFIPIQKSKFSWKSNITSSTNKNKLVSLENDLYKTTNPFFDDGMSPNPMNRPTHRIEVGQPIGNFWMYKVIDITDDGKWIYEDPQGNPSTAKPNPATDRKIVGNGLPKYHVGWNNTFSYGKFDMNINMRGAFGFQVLNSIRLLYENPGLGTYSQLNSAFDKVFDKVVLNKSVPVELNSYYVEQGDYWKIDNVVIGYNHGIPDIKYIKEARLYFSVQNAITFTGYKGMDPEVSLYGTTGSRRLAPGYDNQEKYPTIRVFTLGLNITFN